MKISTRGRYALRLMIDLAIHQDEGPVRVKDISERQSISIKYMEQIISVLNKAGYVRSIRGPQGGYLLTKKPEEYTVGMILYLTEGNMAPVACLEYEVNDCERQASCATLDLWMELHEAIKGVLEKYTLQDLVQKQNVKGRNDYGKDI